MNYTEINEKNQKILNFSDKKNDFVYKDENELNNNEIYSLILKGAYDKFLSLTEFIRFELNINKEKQLKFEVNYQKTKYFELEESQNNIY